VWDCNSYKILDLDDINFGFIKDFWPEVRDDFMRFISEFHRNGNFSKGINKPQRLNDFRSISLVRSLYEVLSKVLANRLWCVIKSISSESQSTFIHGRQILNGILISTELVEDARRTNKDMLLFKVDFEKAFDSVDWGYVEATMKKMNFPTLWWKWIME